MELGNKRAKRVPIKRNSKFFGEEDFNQQLEYMKEYMECDANQSIILYQVDLNKTQVSGIYKEAEKNKVAFKLPVEIPAIYEVKDAEMKSYSNQVSKGIYSKMGKLTITVLIETLKDYNCDINRGDYIGIQLDTNHREYWTVTDDGKTTSTANRYSMFGTKPFARVIECAPIDKNEFNDF